MTLKDDGFRFYVSPDGKNGGWKKPIYQATFYPDWTDTTDLTYEEFLNFLLEKLDDTSDSQYSTHIQRHNASDDRE